MCAAAPQNPVEAKPQKMHEQSLQASTRLLSFPESLQSWRKDYALAARNRRIISRAG